MSNNVSLKLPYIAKTRIPSEYQELEYLQSNGTQWIDTGLKVLKILL